MATECTFRKFGITYRKEGHTMNGQRARGALSDFAPSYREAIHHRDHGLCAYCLGSLWVDGIYKGSLDHITPHSKGGSNEADNLISAHLLCNQKRGTKSLESYIATLDGVRQSARAQRARLAYIYGQTQLPIDRKAACARIRQRKQLERGQ